MLAIVAFKRTSIFSDLFGGIF